MRTSIVAVASGADLLATSRRLQLVLAALLGLTIVGGVGFAPIEAVHNAAHDYRQSPGSATRSRAIQARSTAASSSSTAWASRRTTKRSRSFRARLMPTVTTDDGTLIHYKD